jgi:hypothetical protein
MFGKYSLSPHSVQCAQFIRPTSYMTVSHTQHADSTANFRCPLHDVIFLRYSEVFGMYSKMKTWTLNSILIITSQIPYHSFIDKVSHLVFKHSIIQWCFFCRWTKLRQHISQLWSMFLVLVYGQCIQSRKGKASGYIHQAVLLCAAISINNCLTVIVTLS